MLPGPLSQQLNNRTLTDNQDSFGAGLEVVVAEHTAARVPVMSQAVGQLSSSMLTDSQDGFRAELGVEVAPAEYSAATGSSSRPKAAGVPVMPQAGSAIAEGGCAIAKDGCAIAKGGNATAEGGDYTAQSGCTRFALEQAQPGPAAFRDGNDPRDGECHGAALLGDHAMPEHGAPASPVKDHPAAKGTTAGDDPAAAQTHAESTEPPGTSFSLSAQGCMSTAEDADGDSTAQALNSALQQLARDQTPEIAAAADNIRAATSVATAQSGAAASQPAAATAAGSLAITQLLCTTAQCETTTAVVADTSPVHLDAAQANGDTTAALSPATADETLPTAASTPSLHATDAAEKEEDGGLDQAGPEAHQLALATVALDLSMTDLQTPG